VQPRKTTEEIEANFEIQRKLLPALVEAFAALAPRRELLTKLAAQRQQCVCVCVCVCRPRFTFRGSFE
jgi:hypothetical protein